MCGLANQHHSYVISPFSKKKNQNNRTNSPTYSHTSIINFFFGDRQLRLNCLELGAGLTVRLDLVGGKMDSHLSNGKVNILLLKDQLKRQLVDYFSKFKGTKVGGF